MDPQSTAHQRKAQVLLDVIGRLGQCDIPNGYVSCSTKVNKAKLIGFLTVVLARSCCIHILKGVNGWSVGTMNLLSMIIGVPLMSVRGLDERLKQERSRYLVAELKESPCEAGKIDALYNYLLEKQSQSQQQEREDDDGGGFENLRENKPQVPYRFLTPQGMEIDLRLCNQEIMSSAKPYLLHILNSAMQVRFHEFFPSSPYYILYKKRR